MLPSPSSSWCYHSPSSSWCYLASAAIIITVLLQPQWGTTELTRREQTAQDKTRNTANGSTRKTANGPAPPHLSSADSSWPPTVDYHVSDKWLLSMLPTDTPYYYSHVLSPFSIPTLLSPSSILLSLSLSRSMLKYTEKY